MEFLQVTPEEKLYTEKNLLQSQLELISIVKHLNNHKTLRNEELTLKIAAKGKMDEIKEKIKLFEKLLPKTKLKDKFMEEKRIVHEARALKIPEMHEAMKAKKKDEFDIEWELNEIQKKLAKLK